MCFSRDYLSLYSSAILKELSLGGGFGLSEYFSNSGHFDWYAI